VEFWARVYDQNGEERFAVVIIHAASDLLASGDDALFAAGLDAVAYEVLKQTGKKIGFFIDALPFGTNAPGAFKPTPEATGPELKRSQSLLGIECFIPERWLGLGPSDTEAIVNWKRDFSRRWFQTGLPFLMDVSPGYDGHIVFPHSQVYGLTPEWLSAMSQLNRDFGRDGMVFNSWNGYGESLVALPSQEHGSLFYDWLQSQ
jgi:hypothetical protein